MTTGCLFVSTADFRSFGGRKKKIIRSISSGSKELSSATSIFLTNMLLILGDPRLQCNVATVAQKLPGCIIQRLILGPTVVKGKPVRQLVLSALTLFKDLGLCTEGRQRDDEDDEVLEVIDKAHKKRRVQR